MAVKGEESLLPTPPPPRPAAREAAVEAALRKFDGVDDTSESKVRRRSSRAWWGGTKRQIGGAVATAALIVVVGIPAAMIALRDQTIAPQASKPLATQPDPNAVADGIPAPAPVGAEPTEQPASPPPPAPEQPTASQPLSLAPVARNASPADEPKALNQAPVPMTGPAAAPSPPPPPPPPAPQVVEEAGTQEIVLTGTRAARSDFRKQRKNREEASTAASPPAAMDANAEFLFRLQSALRANNKPAILGLVGLPLRVNFDEGARTYRDRKSVERDFDRIFTPRVRQAILNQSAGSLFTNYQGAMIGAGEVWFDGSCIDSACSRSGSVRIKAVNP